MKYEGLTYERAMARAENGDKVRHDDMNQRWGVTWSRDSGYMLRSTLGGSYPYVPSALDKEAKWSIMS